MADPWAFGWNQLFAVIGFGITIVIAIGGFRSFNRWKREQLEARRIDVALEALSIAYESKYVFDHIRSPMAFEYEWREMPVRSGETESERSSRGSFFAVRKRIVDYKDFFERAIRLHPKMMAIFGAKAEEPFVKLQRARREIEVSSEMLEWESTRPRRADGSDDELDKQLRADIWSGVGDAMKTKEGDRVGKKLNEFQAEIEELCRPIVDRQYGKSVFRSISRLRRRST